MNHKRVERIWRQEGLKVPKKQPRKGPLWFNDGRIEAPHRPVNRFSESQRRLLLEVTNSPDFTRPSVSNDNPYSDLLFKTLKWPRPLLLLRLS